MVFVFDAHREPSLTKLANAKKSAKTAEHTMTLTASVSAATSVSPSPQEYAPKVTFKAAAHNSPPAANVPNVPQAIIFSTDNAPKSTPNVQTSTLT